MERLETLRKTIDEILRAQPNEDLRRDGFVHLYGVSAAAVLLAGRRGLNPELAAAAGMLHDLWTYQTGDSKNHEQLGEGLAEGLLTRQGNFTTQEIKLICQAVARHGDKMAENAGPLGELLKDADVCSTTCMIRRRK